MLDEFANRCLLAAPMAAAEKPRFPVLAGWIAGSLEIVVTYPLEFVKTQLQLQVTSSARPGHDRSRPTDL